MAKTIKKNLQNNTPSYEDDIKNPSTEMEYKYLEYSKKIGITNEKYQKGDLNLNNVSDIDEYMLLRTSLLTDSNSSLFKSQFEKIEKTLKDMNQEKIDILSQKQKTTSDEKEKLKYETLIKVSQSYLKYKNTEDTEEKLNLSKEIIKNTEKLSFNKVKENINENLSKKIENEQNPDKKKILEDSKSNFETLDSYYNGNFFSGLGKENSIKNKAEELLAKKDKEEKDNELKAIKDTISQVGKKTSESVNQARNWLAEVIKPNEEDGIKKVEKEKEKSAKKTGDKPILKN